MPATALHPAPPDFVHRTRRLRANLLVARLVTLLTAWFATPLVTRFMTRLVTRQTPRPASLRAPWLAILAPFTALAAFCALALPAGAAHAQAEPLVQARTLRQVSAHVRIVPDAGVPLVPNVGLVVGERAILVIDTGLGPRNGAQVAALAQKLGAPPRALYLVTTHFHPEHDLGAQAFPADTKMIRSADQQKDIAEFGLQLARVFAQRSAINAQLLEGAQFRPADISFEAEHRLDLGGVTVRLIAMGANHTRGDTAVWVEGDRVLFSGDVAMRPQPAFASPCSSLTHWLASLDRMQALQPTLIVPSHGPTGGVELIEGYRGYLTEIRDRALAAKQAGQGADEAARAITEAMGARYPDRGRLGGAALAGYRELK
jgi:glyoxylase-like metal-dependent hydrolase (beta-lactamase superfamily II)